MNLLLQIVNLGLISLAQVLRFDYLMLFFLEEILDLLVQNADLGDVLLVQAAHLLEHLGLKLGAFLVVVLVLEFQHILKLINPRLFLLNLTLQLQYLRIMLILYF